MELCSFPLSSQKKKTSHDNPHFLHDIPHSFCRFGFLYYTDTLFIYPQAQSVPSSHIHCSTPDQSLDSLYIVCFFSKSKVIWESLKMAK